MPKTKEQKREYQRQYRARQRREMEEFVALLASEIQKANDDLEVLLEWKTEKSEYLEIANTIIADAVETYERTGKDVDREHAQRLFDYWAAFHVRYDELMNADEQVQRAEMRMALQAGQTP